MGSFSTGACLKLERLTCGSSAGRRFQGGERVGVDMGLHRTDTDFHGPTRTMRFFESLTGSSAFRGSGVPVVN